MRSPQPFLAAALLFALVQLAASSPTTDGDGDGAASSPSPPPRPPRSQISSLERAAFSASSRPGSTHADNVDAWTSVLVSDSRSLTARVRLGILLISHPDGDVQERGIARLEEAFDPSIVDAAEMEGVLGVPGDRAFVLAQTIGRYRWQRKEFGPARKFLELARRAKPGDVCGEMMSASALDVFPESVVAEDASARLYHEGMDRLIRRARAEAASGEKLRLDPVTVGTVPGAKTDPYVHCLCTLFYHSFYYRSEPAPAAAKHFEVAAHVWPELLYVAPQLREKNEAPESLTEPDIPKLEPKPRVRRRIKLGVASGFLSPHSSVTADFSGMLRRLPRSIFEITYIFFSEQGGDVDPFVYDHEDDRVRVYWKSGEGHKWMKGVREEIAGMELDLLLYLDLTMSTFAHRMGMSRLAPVQAVSHGHPLTSGFPRHIMNYYISWGAAELSHESAQNRYTEELKLLPSENIHQYYDNRILTEEGARRRSSVDGMRYDHLVSSGRSAAFPSIPDPDGAHWYLCMQKPFKLHPEFDPLVCGILASDPGGMVLLHEEERESNRIIFRRRLETAGCDMDRVAFVPAQPHHRLLALYELSDVVLDSYPAGGCTTTREALEAGRAVVTLPARFLGSRWSLAYYRVLGDRGLSDLVVASSPEEYVRLAVDLGTDRGGARREAEQRIRNNVHKMFRRDESVEGWTRTLLEIAPVDANIGARKEEREEIDSDDIAASNTGGGRTAEEGEVDGSQAGPSDMKSEL